MFTACEQQIENPFGESGWKDAEDFETVRTENANGDSLDATRLSLFSEENFMFSLMLDGTEFLGACEASEGGTNKQGPTQFESFESNLMFTVGTQDELMNTYSVEATLLVGNHEETGVEMAVGLFGIMGAQPLPETAVDDFSRADQLEIWIRDKCDNDLGTRYFNVSGNLGEMLRTLDQRKADAQNAEVDKEFQ